MYMLEFLKLWYYKPMNPLVIAFANSLVALGLCLIIGYVCRRKRMLNDVHVSGFSELLVKVTLPCTVFVSFMRPFSRELLVESLLTFVITGIIYILSGYLGLGLMKLTKATPGASQSWRFGIGFPNVAFMGIPVIMAVFGEDGMIYVSMAIASFNVLAFTHGMRMFENAPKDLNLKKLLTNAPVLIVVVVGFMFFVTGLRLPFAFENGIALIGGMTTPISMIIIGAILARQRLKDSLMDFKVLPSVAMRLLVVPLVSFFVLRLFISNVLMLNVIVTLVGMPVAAMTAIFAEQYDADALAGAKFVVVSTILCVVTVPVIALLF